MARVFVLDSTPQMLRALSTLLARHRHAAVLFTGLESLLPRLREKPDAVICSGGLAKPDSHVAARLIRRQCPDAVVLLLWDRTEAAAGRGPDASPPQGALACGRAEVIARLEASLRAGRAPSSPAAG